MNTTNPHINIAESIQENRTIYISSDTHFNHKRIASLCNRPENHEAILWAGINRLTTKDCLIHLGDFCLGRELELHEQYIQYLPCHKILIRGNHDSKSLSWYREHGWDEAYDFLRYEYAGWNILFSHIPQRFDGTWTINIHGHLHNSGHRAAQFPYLGTYHKLYAPELRNYAPIELNQLLKETRQETEGSPCST